MTDTVSATLEQLACPRTPAEAKRHWMIDRLWSIFLFSSVLVAVLSLIVAFGSWPVTLAARRLSMLAGIVFVAQLVQLAVVMAFSLGGPVGRWRARWGDRSFAADDDETSARHAYEGGDT